MGNKSGREREALRREEEARLKREKETGNKPGISQRILSDEEQFDVGEKFIRDKGCWEPYMRAVKCISVTNDWAQCPDEVDLLRNPLKFFFRPENYTSVWLAAISKTRLRTILDL